MRDALITTGPEVKGQGSPSMWRMQSTQDQPLALTTGRSLCPTNGKEEEMDAGEEAGLAGFFERRPGTLRSKVV